MMWFKRLLIAVALLIGAAAPALPQTGAQFPAGSIWGNDTASARAGKVATVTAIMDRAFGSTRGSVLMRGAAGWQLVTPGTSTFPLTSNGAGADLSYVQVNFTALAGRGTLAQLPQGIANSIFINPTGSTANMQNVAVPSCANDGSHALVYVNASGLACATITASAGTVTSVIVTAGPGIGVSGTCNSTTSINCAVAQNNSMGANKYQVFATGSGTIPTPTGAAWAKYTMVGGGGGGGGGGSTGTTGTAGNPSCIKSSGAACTTPEYQAGGGGAGSFSPGTGGTGGTCSGSIGTFVDSVVGGTGVGAPTVPSASFPSAGTSGGNTSRGGAGASGYGNATGASAAVNSGSGAQGGGAAAGASNFGASGGGGGATCAIFIQSPAASYTYAVGATAAGGAAGASGSAGGAGGSGYISAEFGFN